MKNPPRRKSIFPALAFAAALCLLCVGCGGGESAERKGPAAQSGAPAPTQTSPAATPSANAVANANVAVTPGGGDLTERDDTSTDDFEGTAAAVEKERKGAAPVVLKAVRTAQHPKFDRVVFEFDGATPPGYLVEYVDKPVRQCGSGEAVTLAGDGWLRVRLTPAQAHTEAGEATVKDRSQKPDYSNLKELKTVCDFEGEVEWVLGLAAPNRYRVLELSNPARLVVDVKR